MYFCNDNGELFMLEVMMRQVPGFRPRRSGIRVVNQDLTMSEVFGNKGKEEMKLRMEMYDVPERIQKDVAGRDGEDELFLNEAHKDRFMEVLGGSCKRLMQENGRFLAAVFLLCSDERLWNETKDQVTELGIMFDDSSVQKSGEAQKILYYSAREIYAGAKYISLESVVKSESVSDRLLSVIVSAYLLRVAGVNLARG